MVEPEARGRCVRTPRVSLDNKCALSETGCVPSNSPEIWRALLATPPLRGHMALLLLGVLSPAGALLAGAAISPTDRARNFWVLCGRDGVPPAGSLELCKDIVSAQRAGDAEAIEQAMRRIGQLPVAVEMAAAPDGGRRFALPATTAATAAASRGGLLEFSELSFGEGGHGSKTWPAGVALSIWAQRNAHFVAGQRVLELGSGIGIAGLSAALAGAPPGP